MFCWPKGTHRAGDGLAVFKQTVLRVEHLARDTDSTCLLAKNIGQASQLCLRRAWSCELRLHASCGLRHRQSALAIDHSRSTHVGEATRSRAEHWCGLWRLISLRNAGLSESATSMVKEMHCCVSHDHSHCRTLICRRGSGLMRAERIFSYCSAGAR